MRKEYVAKFALPVLLCLIAITQIYYSHTEYLTPWKGGGFGMFASIDRMERRVIQITAETDQKKFVINPNIIIAGENRYKRLQAMPSKKKLKEIHDSVFHRRWMIDSTSVLPSRFHETIEEMGYSIHPMVPATYNEKMEQEVKKVRIAVKRMIFNRESNVLELKVLISHEE